ncbi:MAG TPA: FAD-binding oxidoreductase [Candidatus Polarisedimenticolia bacterium]|nr:FAD-binding oxidoreductase [Candidatus Polarisedimenticolia bacterium]
MKFMNLSLLRSKLRGEVLEDESSKRRYSTAECIYRVVPSAAVLPAETEDVLETLSWARHSGVPVTARGAGSAVAGQSVGSGIILDFSPHLNRVLQIDAEKRQAIVQPGVVLAELNRQAARHSLRFAPDPSSGAFCTLGGMIANNAGGPRSVRYGPTRDHVVGLKVALAGGVTLQTRSLDQGALEAGEDLLAALSKALRDRVEADRAALERTAPHVRRVSSGYELLRAVQGESVDLAQLLVGSEGTLGLTLEATLRLIDLPGGTATALLHFRDLESMGQGVLRVLEHHPSAVEALDRSFLDLIREAGQEEARALPAGTEAVLIVELEGEDEMEAAHRLERLAADLVRPSLAAGIVRGLEPRTRERIWEIRKAASPILTARQRRLRNTRFIEDACVPTERLPEFLRAIRRILAEHRLEAAIFGHAGDAILHVNPQLDAGDPGIAALMERVAVEYAAMVLGMGGALSGEHGDGRLRTPFLEQAFGEVVGTFRRVKELFDPDNLLNPGIKVHDGTSRMTDHLDLGPRAVHEGIPVW